MSNSNGKWIFLRVADFWDSAPEDMRESDIKRLEFDIVLGLGTIIEGTNGYHIIRCGNGGAYGKSGKSCAVVYVMYPKYKVVAYVRTFPDVSYKLTKVEKSALKKIKLKIDVEIEKNFG